MKKLFLSCAMIAACMAPAISHAGKHYHSEAHAKHQSKNSIVDIAASNENFSTLVAALKAADLVNALQANGPFTVFAPSNEAFSKLPKGTLDDLLKPENKSKLQAILKYHVVAQKVAAEDALGAKTSLDTLHGERILVDGSDGKVRVKNATVTSADINASNGVIHVIDTVLLP